MTPLRSKLFPEIDSLIQNFNTAILTEERREILNPLVEFIQNKKISNETIRINFICTHNSRRSHLSQIWAQTMAHYFEIDNVHCYSAGTERTALFTMVVETLKNSGFNIEKLSEGNNPVYSIKYAKNEHPIVGFSKTLDASFNPENDFAAVMTCDSANEACPFIAGATVRIPVTYEDPKVFDNTPLQAEKYMERSLQIALEMYYIFSQIKS